MREREWTNSQENEIPLSELPNHVRPYRKLVTIYSELQGLQCKFRKKVQSPMLGLKWGKGKKYGVYLSEYKLYFWYKRLHTRNILSCTECLNLQEVIFHFLRQCLYVELPPSVDDTAYWRRPFHQLSDINFVFKQILLNPQPCHYVRTTATECHINNLSKQIIGGCKHLNFLDVLLTNLWLLKFSDFHSFSASLEGFTNYIVFPCITFHPYRHSVLMFGGTIHSVM